MRRPAVPVANNPTVVGTYLSAKCRVLASSAKTKFLRVTASRQRLAALSAYPLASLCLK